MKPLFIKAEHHNWGLSTAWDWNKDIFELSQDGDLHIVVQFYEPVVDCVVKVTESDMEKLRALIACVPVVIKKVNACDGEAWSFSAYNEFGKQIFHYELGYIYGIREMEKIGEILCSYIPDYGDPSQEEYLKWEESKRIEPSPGGGLFGFVMVDEPIPGRRPEEILEWYKTHHSEADLAHAFADASNKFFWVEDDEFDHEKGTPEYEQAIVGADA